METKELLSDDTSSSEEETDLINEAVDPEFLSDNLYKCHNSLENNEKPSKPPPSLRNQYHQEVSINPFTVKVTPEFQKHVSKHLTKILDELIVEKDVVFKNKKMKKERERSGIRLLKNSKDYLDSYSKSIMLIKSERYSSKQDLSESDNERRAKEVAVTPEWVLRKEDTKHWAPNTKGKIEILKLNTGCMHTNLKKVKRKKNLIKF